MKNVIRAFIKYPILGHVILVSLFLFGFVGFKSMKTTFFPLIPSKTIMIEASYPGASPEEIEEAIVTKIEDNLKGLTGIERITSSSSENSCRITVTVLTGFDVNIVLQDVKNAVDKISSFPVEMERLTVYREEARNFGIDFVVTGNVDLHQLKKMARKVERDLRAKNGVSKITLSGFPSEEIEISLRENDLRRYGLTFDTVVNAVSAANIKMTGGKIKGDKEEMLIRANVKGYYAEDLANHVLRSTDDGAIIRLKDVASLIDRWSEDPNRVFYNGQPAVRVTVQSTNQEDLFQVTDIVKDYIKQFNQANKDVQAKINRDGSEIIQERINILSSNGIMGLILLIIFLSLALNVRISFWVALSIPISFAGMLAMGPAYGLTINVMSLLAMILVLGILVDDGIVIAENIYQHHESGKSPAHAALVGTLEVLPSVLASVLTTVVIFATFFFLEGGMGDRSRDLAFVVVATLLISLVEATFILPAHIAHSKALKGVAKDGEGEGISQRILRKFRDRVYAPVLKFAIKYPAIVIAIPIAIFVITIGALKGGIIKTTFFPYIERRDVDITLAMPAGTSEAVTADILDRIEKKIWEVNDIYKKEHQDGSDLIQSIVRRVGSGTHEGSLSVTLISSELRDWTSLEAGNRMRQQVGVIPSAEKLEFGGQGFWGKPISIALKSTDLDQLRAAKLALKEELNKITRLKDVTDNDPPGLREVTINLKEKAFSLGLNTKEVIRQVRQGFFGGEAQRILRGIDEVKIWARYSREDRSTLARLENMRIRLTDGREFPLEEIADYRIDRGVMSVNHLDGQRIIMVEADIAGLKDSVPDILQDIATEVMPVIIEQFPSVHYSYEGQNYENQKTSNAMVKVVPPIVILMFLIVVINFRSFGQAIIVFILIPFSLIGVLWGHFVQGYMFSILSMFGAIALIGIVVNDSLVFVSAMNRYLKTGMTFKEAIFETGITRFRPVLLTSLTTIAGLGPLIFESSHQAQFLSPMAISVAYGLLLGTMLTLVMLPALLVVVNRIKVNVMQWFKKQPVSEESVEPAIREELFQKEQES